MKIRESAENYLEAIYILSQKGDAVRSIDVAVFMGYSKPSISIAMKALREDGYITVESGGELVLLEPGLEIAEKMYERHCMIAGMLKALGVDEKTATEDACKMEHVISEKSFECIKRHWEQYLK